MNDISLCTVEIIAQDLDRYGDMILRLAYSYMKNIHDAEDVLPDVFVQLMRNIDIFVSSEHKKSWLITVTRNLCKNKLKSSWFKKRDELVEMPYYDKYKDNDILIAIIISLMFLSKQTLGVLVIPSIVFSKNKKNPIKY